MDNPHLLGWRLDPYLAFIMPDILREMRKNVEEKRKTTKEESKETA